MRVTKGYVATKEDGTFLIIRKVTRWGSDSVEVSETNEIEQATILDHPSHRMITGRHDLNYPHKFMYVPVEVTREVKLIGWGVA